MYQVAAMEKSFQLHQSAVGPCVKCGQDATGSLYWTPMSLDMWAKIRPQVIDMFEKSKVQNIFFVPGVNDPFCGLVCVTKREEDYETSG